jgi:serine/threonine-protein kinase
MADRFDLQKRLGAGHFGEVWIAIDVGLGIERAVKLIHPSRIITPHNFFQEAQTLKAVEHPNVVRAEETGTLDDGRIYVAMEYLPRGSLEDEAKGAYVDLTRAKGVMVDVLRGLGHAHRHGILHRDIKPGNILIGNKLEAKLSDFGLALPTNIDLKSLGIKDYNYILHQAPEVQQTGQHSIQADIYACGVTLYRLINGDSYLPSISLFDIPSLIACGEFPNRRRYREFITRPLRRLVNKAMHVSPDKRYQSAENMRHSLEQIVIEKNWIEKSLSNGMQWMCSWENVCYEVTRQREPSDSWTVAVRKGASKEELRRIRRLCTEGLTKTEAERLTGRILQDFVLGRIK